MNDRGLADVTWHGTKLGSPGWSDPHARALALTLAGFNGDPDLHVMLNMHWESLDFEVPEVAGRRWFKAVDTAGPLAWATKPKCPRAPSPYRPVAWWCWSTEPNRERKRAVYRGVPQLPQENAFAPANSR